MPKFRMSDSHKSPKSPPVLILNIKRCEGDETEEDLARFFGTYVENQSE